jgi:hypothetical protein
MGARRVMVVVVMVCGAGWSSRRQAVAHEANLPTLVNLLPPPHPPPPHTHTAISKAGSTAVYVIRPACPASTPTPTPTPTRLSCAPSISHALRSAACLLKLYGSTISVGTTPHSWVGSEGGRCRLGPTTRRSATRSGSRQVQAVGP